MVFSSSRLRLQPQTLPHSDHLAWLSSATLQILIHYTTQYTTHDTTHYMTYYTTYYTTHYTKHYMTHYMTYYMTHYTTHYTTHYMTHYRTHYTVHFTTHFLCSMLCGVPTPIVPPINKVCAVSPLPSFYVVRCPHPMCYPRQQSMFGVPPPSIRFFVRCPPQSSFFHSGSVLDSKQN